MQCALASRACHRAIAESAHQKHREGKGCCQTEHRVFKKAEVLLHLSNFDCNNTSEFSRSKNESFAIACRFSGRLGPLFVVAAFGWYCMSDSPTARPIPKGTNCKLVGYDSGASTRCFQYFSGKSSTPLVI